jgi:hypothetical protein
VGNDALYSGFCQPPRGFGTVPWWIWNGRLDYAEIERQVRLMAEAGLEGWMLWARFGLEIEYLSDEFMRRFRFAVQKSAEAGLDVWVFDEYAWPSGSAHNRVPTKHPEYRMRVLSCIREEVAGGHRVSRSYPPPPASRDLAVVEGASATGGYIDGELARDERRIERVLAVPLRQGVPDLTATRDITAAVQGFELRWNAPAGDWLVLAFVSRDYRNYIDPINPAAVAAFIEETHERYRQWVGEYFGRVVKGFFLDEPRWLRRGIEKPQFSEPTIPYTQDLFGRLEQAGLDEVDAATAALFVDLERLPPAGAQQAVGLRVRFWRTLTDLYRDAYFAPLAEWAARHDMLYSGDCFTEETLILVALGDYFHVVAPLHLPGMDSLCDLNVANAMVRKGPKFPSSLAHRLGRRAMAEGPGLLGWDTTLQRLKGNADWLLAYGVSFLVPNAFFYTIAHEQFYEPPSYFHQWTLWPYYRRFDGYFRRLAWLLAQGTHVADAALFYPTATLQAHYTPPPTRLAGGEALQAGGEMTATMQYLVDAAVTVADALLRHQVDFDYVDETALEQARIEEGRLCVGAESFPVLVLPPLTTIGRAAWQKILALVAEGGRVIATGALPGHCWDDASPTVEPAAALTPCPGIECLPLPAASAKAERVAWEESLKRQSAPRIELVPLAPTADTAGFATLCRRVGDDEVFFISNLLDREQRATVRLRTRLHPELWEPQEGKRRPLTCDRTEDSVVFEQAFAPNQSLLVVARRENRLPAGRAKSLPARSCQSLESWEFEILQDNLHLPAALTCTSEWTVRRPWEGMAVHRYRFPLVVAGAFRRLALVLDNVQTFWRLRRLRVLVNGKPVEVAPNRTLDVELLEADLRQALAPGENEVCIEYDYTDYADVSFDLHSKRTAPPPVPKVRVMGAFKSSTRGGGAVLVAAGSERVGNGSWTEFGYPLYSGAARYRTTVRLPGVDPAQPAGLVFEDLAGVVEVRLNGVPVGEVLWPPWRLEVTGRFHAGENTVELLVTNTQANQMYEDPRPSGLLGPVRLEW